MYNEERTPAFRTEQAAPEKVGHYVFQHRKTFLPAAAAADYVVSDRIKNSPLYVAAREFPAGPLSGIR